MAKDFAEFKEELLSTEYPEWRNKLSSLTLLILVTSVVLSFWYLYLTVPGLECYRGFFYFSFLWLIVQWIVIGYLYWFSNVPRFARTAIKVMIAVANCWFILFVFSLTACV